MKVKTIRDTSAKGLNDYVVLNKGKIVGIDVKPIRR